VTLKFEKVVRTKNVFVPGIQLLPVLEDVGNSLMETKKRETIDVKNLHKILGIFRARLIAYGYSQVPGVDFQENFTPVINDVTFCILLITMLTWNLKGKIIDIETTFLHGNLRETIYMEIPKGV
jgi:hypothetical protein